MQEGMETVTGLPQLIKGIHIIKIAFKMKKLKVSWLQENSANEKMGSVMRAYRQHTTTVDDQLSLTSACNEYPSYELYQGQDLYN